MVASMLSGPSCEVVSARSVLGSPQSIESWCSVYLFLEDSKRLECKRGGV